MERIYFTFGSDPKFPYGRGDYVVVVGAGMNDCVQTFKKKYPNEKGRENIVLCADYYTAKQWEANVKEYYENVSPKEILVSDAAYGCRPYDFSPLWLFIPSRNVIIFLQEGSGDNLLPEDKKLGYVDYVDVTAFELQHGEVDECDGGQLMLTELVQEKYQCLADTIPAVMDFLYDEPYLDAVILHKTEK